MTLALMTLERFYRDVMPRPGIVEYPPAEWSARLVWQRPEVAPAFHLWAGYQALQKGATALDARIPVRVEHGRWLVDCPDCNSAQIAAETDPRFLCVVCLNDAVGGLWRPVVWPKDPARIERALLSRRDVKRRNWRPSDGAGKALLPDPTR